MSYVWILEKWVSVAETELSVKEFKAMKDASYDKLDESGKASMDSALNTLEGCLLESRKTGGYWLGYQGKSDYRVFCEDSIQTIKSFNKSHSKNLEISNKFRVLKAELIDESSNTWLNNYTNCEEKVGVANYLMIEARKDYYK